MTSPLTPAEIETLRKIVNGELDREVDYAAIIAANKILDRLSPPAPEVDEATAWTDRVVAILNARLASDDDRSQEELVIPILRELIASKDAEIAEWKLASEEARSHWDSAVHEWNKAETELAALRAENERLKGEADEAEKLAEQYHNIAEDIEIESSRLRAQIEVYKTTRAGELRRCFRCSSPVKEGETHNDAQCANMMRIQEMFPAAERNPAELEKKLPDLIVTKGGVPFEDQAEGIRQFKAACLANSKPTDTAPVVEVTQARECVKEIFGFTDETLDAVGDDKQPIEIVGRYISEAEARGRREALEAVKRVMFKFEDALATAGNFQRMVNDLRTLIMTEVK